MNHGHVTPNPDGSLMRCGGPGICAQCSRELVEKLKEDKRETVSNEEKTLGEIAFEATPSRLTWEEQPEHWREYWEKTAHTIIAEWQRRNPSMRIDDPELDATDFAHSAWWRGHEHAFKVLVQQVNKMLDGEPLHGTAQPEWQRIRERIAELVGQRRNVEPAQLQARCILKRNEHGAWINIQENEYQKLEHLKDMEVRKLYATPQPLKLPSAEEIAKAIYESYRGSWNEAPQYFEKAAHINMREVVLKLISSTSTEKKDPE